MQAEQLGRGLALVVDDLLFVVGLRAHRRHALGLVDVEVLLAREHLRVDELADERLDEPFVLAVGDAPALVDFGREDFHHFVLDFVRVLDHHEQLVFGDAEVSVAEVVGRRGPADRAELLAVDQQGVEERAAEQQGLEGLGLLGAVQLLVVVLVPGVEHHLLDVARRLHGHFDALLQDRHGEVGRRRRSQEQPELAVDVLRGQVLDHLVERGDPGQLHVGVLLHQPGPVEAVLLVHGFGLLALALAERQVLQRAACDAFGVRLQVVQRVRPGRQNEDDRSLFRGRLVALGDVEERRLGEELAHDLDDVVLDGFVDLVGPDRLVDEQLLERVQVDVPLARERHGLGVFGVVDRLELLRVRHELLLEAVEAAQVL